MSARSTKLYFNRKDIQNHEPLRRASAMARLVYYEMAYEAAGCATPGHMTDGKRAMDFADIARLCRIGLDEVTAAIRELVERGAVTIRAGVIVVTLVVRAAGRSMKNAANAKGTAQGNLFKTKDNLRSAGRAVKYGGRSKACSASEDGNSPPLYPPRKNKNIFIGFDQIPASITEGERQNREEITDPSARWAFLGNVVKLREIEIQGLMARHGAGRAEIEQLLEKHEAYCCDPAKLPDSKLHQWRFMLVGFIDRHFQMRRAGVAAKAGA